MSYEENGFLKEDTGALLVSGLAAPVAELFPGYTAGTPMTLDLVSSDPNFVLSNVERGTDPADDAPAALLTAVGSYGTIKTAVDIENVRIAVRFRPVARSVFDITNLYIALLGRYVDDNNEWRTQRAWSDGNSYFQALSVTGGAAGTAVLGGGMDNTNSTDDRWIVMDVFEDEIIRAKEWVVGDSEPDWFTGPHRLRGASGFSDIPTTDVDNPLTGKAGLRFIYGFYVKEFTVTPLERVSTSLIDNLDLSVRKTTHEPWFWDRSSVLNDATNGLYVVSATTHDGQTRDVFQAKKDNDTDQGPLWEQHVFLDGAADNIYFTREHPRPGVTPFPASIRMRGWSKGTNVVNTSGADPANQLNAHWVAYYDSAAGDLLMNTEGHQDDYHGTFGPNNGLGTWDWWEFDHTFPVNSVADVVHMRFSWGLHDFTCMADELLFEITSIEAA